MFSNAHIVSNSFFPFFLSCHIFSMMLSLVMMMSCGIMFVFFMNGIFVMYLLLLWLKDIMMEGVSGFHNYLVDAGFLKGFIIFIMTEIMFFFSIFWVLFNKFILESMQWGLGALICGVSLPMINTFLLLLSGVAGTWVHSKSLSSKKFKFLLMFVIFLGFLFLLIQMYEYKNLFFNMGDGVAGSLFYFLTGFHGFHVIVGVMLLKLSFLRIYFFNYSLVNNFFFDCSIIYWHFVDIVWLLLFLLIYL
uniref:Cytochrome c oxidase subunit 3 n=1 Tax=Gyrinicola batrachiensis TaxID=3029840 RepID=A0AB39A5E8_9BILA